MDLEDPPGSSFPNNSYGNGTKRDSSHLPYRPNGMNGHSLEEEDHCSILNRDVLMLILDILHDRHQDRYHKSVELISVDRRVNLSQESFNVPSPEINDLETVGNFRLVCKSFNEIGAEYQCCRVTTRFSEKGLKRLENIAKSPFLAKKVLKFSYMIPCFFKG
jgi:hypothetical protein